MEIKQTPEKNFNLKFRDLLFKYSLDTRYQSRYEGKVDLGSEISDPNIIEFILPGGKKLNGNYLPNIKKDDFGTYENVTYDEDQITVVFSNMTIKISKSTHNHEDKFSTFESNLRNLISTSGGRSRRSRRSRKSRKSRRRRKR